MNRLCRGAGPRWTRQTGEMGVQARVDLTPNIARRWTVAAHEPRAVSAIGGCWKRGVPGWSPESFRKCVILSIDSSFPVFSIACVGLSQLCIPCFPTCAACLPLSSPAPLSRIVAPKTPISHAP